MASLFVSGTGNTCPFASLYTVQGFFELFGCSMLGKVVFFPSCWEVYMYVLLMPVREWHDKGLSSACLVVTMGIAPALCGVGEEGG